MENKVITLQINFTRKSLLVLIGTLLLAAGLVVAGVALAQTPQESKAEPPLEPATYDPTLYPRLPQQMNYQGILEDADGNLIDGSHDLTLTLYNGVSGSWNAAYSETQTVAVNDGLFNVVIGEIHPLNPDDFRGPLELGVKVDGGPELWPRAELFTVPYAFRAEYVNRFPAPHYNSGWIEFPDGATELTHNLGGDPDNYVVDMMCKSTLHPGVGAGVHNWFLGGENYYNSSSGELSQRGAWWRLLDSDSIQVYRQADDAQCGQVRIRIWRID